MVIKFSVGKQLINALLMVMEIRMLGNLYCFLPLFKKKWLQYWEGRREESNDVVVSF